MVEEEIVEAARMQKILKIWYYKYTVSGSRRSYTYYVEVYSYRTIGGITYLMAWNIDKDDHIRSYRIERIHRARVLSSTFVPKFTIEI